MKMTKTLYYFYSFVAVFFTFFLVTGSDRLRVWNFFFFLFFLIFTVYHHFQIVSKPRQLQQRLQVLNSVGRYSLAGLTKEYQQLCLLHQQLPEEHQGRYQQPLQDVRERIERILKAAKVMETLLQKSGKGGLPAQQRNYTDIFMIYQKLPEDVQQEYYPQLLQAKAALEGKSKV